MRRAIPQFLPPKDKLPSVPSGEPPITGRQRANSGPLQQQELQLIRAAKLICFSSKTSQQTNN